MKEDPSKLEEVTILNHDDGDTSSLGKVIKEGTIQAQDDSEEWVSCHVAVREKGITLAFHHPTQDGDNYENGYQNREVSHDVMKFSSSQDVVIEMLPDHARRSRESKLFPFALRRNKDVKKQEEDDNKGESEDEEMKETGEDDMEMSITSQNEGTDDITQEEKDASARDEVILATSNGREMWKWASTIRWLGNPPIEEKIPVIHEPAITRDHNKHYENPQVLQDVLLKMFMYKNLPQLPVKFEDLARIDREKQIHSLRFLFFPSGFFPRGSSARNHDYYGYYDYSDQSSSSEESDTEEEEEEEIENYHGNLFSSSASNSESDEQSNAPSPTEESDDEEEEIENAHGNLFKSPAPDSESDKQSNALEDDMIDQTSTSQNDHGNIDGSESHISTENLYQPNIDVIEPPSDETDQSPDNNQECNREESGVDLKRDITKTQSLESSFQAIREKEINGGLDDMEETLNGSSGQILESHTKCSGDKANNSTSETSTEDLMTLSQATNTDKDEDASKMNEVNKDFQDPSIKIVGSIEDFDVSESHPSHYFGEGTSIVQDPDADVNKNDEDVDPEEPAIEIIENHEHVFGLFAYIVLVGTCIQVNEKCFELITSANLYDLSSQVTWKGNSPFSMLCEGDYNISRNYIVKALWRLGYPSIDGFHANCTPNMAFSIFVAKPSCLWGVGNVTGQPVHLDDQKLCRLLRDKGDGKEANEELTKQLIKASEAKSNEFDSRHNQKITDIQIPKSVVDWGCSFLTKLNLCHNGIFELPDEIYSFTNLTHLDLSRNCLFGLSHKLGNLINLQELDIETNLITELPDTIEKLDKITSFECMENPITKPPSAVWSNGITSIRNYFKDMRESGTEVNVDMRVLVLGLSEAGKTSLINGLINPYKRALTRIGDRTVGIEKRTWVMERSDGQQPVNLLMYDFAGQEEYYITHHLFLGNRALYILAFDLSKYEDQNLDKQILLWWDSIQDRVCDVKSTDSKTPKVIIVGTHADEVDDAQVLADTIHKCLKKRFQCRMKGLKERYKALDKELDKLDPRRAKAIDVNDVADGEKLYEELPMQKKMEILARKSEMEKIEHQQECTIALPSEIHAVSSLNMQNFEMFRAQIASSLIEVGPSGKYFPQLDEHLPRSWFRVRKFVRDQSTRKGRECMRLPQYFKLLSDELGISESLGRRATQFCHDLGDVLFFDKEGLVFLRPSFLIDVFKLLIRHDHKESTYWTEDMLEHGIEEEKFNKGKELLLQKGELEEWLLDLLWSRLDDDIGPESAIRNNLIQLLETFDIATPVEHEGCKKLLIPEFQPKYINIQWPTNKEKGEFEAQRWISIDRTLPRGLLKRIQVRIIKHIYKRNHSNEFHLSQNRFYISGGNSTKLYCTVEQGTKEHPGLGGSEGVRLHIRGGNKQHVLSLLLKVYNCIDETLKEFPGLQFDHYAVHTSQSKPLFIKVEELKAKRRAGETNIQGGVDINDLLPQLPSIRNLPQRMLKISAK